MLPKRFGKSSTGIAVLLLVLGCVAMQSNSQNKLSIVKATAQRAIGMTNSMTDLGKSANFKAIPSLGGFNGEMLAITNFTWVCRLHGETITNHFIRTLKMLVDEKSGQLVWLESEWPAGVPGTRFPALDVYERQLSFPGQKIVGIPTEAPKVSLQEAMQYAMGFATAKQVIVYYVLESYPDRSIKPRPVWIIHVWGCAPVTLSVPPGEVKMHISEDARNHFRTIVDAQTGEYYGSDSIPQPQ